MLLAVLSHNMTDTMSPQTRSAVMAQIRGSNTGPELTLRHALHMLGYRYRLYPHDLPGRPDIVFRGARVAIFVHGCFWHGCPAHYTAPETRPKFWHDKLAATRARDRSIRSSLLGRGWCVIELWEHEIDTDLEGCIARVVANLNRA